MYKIKIDITPKTKEDTFQKKQFHKSFSGFETSEEAMKYLENFVKHGAGFNARFLKQNPKLFIEGFVLRGDDSPVNCIRRTAVFNTETEVFELLKAV